MYISIIEDVGYSKISVFFLPMILMRHMILMINYFAIRGDGPCYRITWKYQCSIIANHIV